MSNSSELLFAPDDDYDAQHAEDMEVEIPLSQTQGAIAGSDAPLELDLYFMAESNGVDEMDPALVSSESCVRSKSTKPEYADLLPSQSQNPAWAVPSLLGTPNFRKTNRIIQAPYSEPSLQRREVTQEWSSLFSMPAPMMADGPIPPAFNLPPNMSRSYNSRYAQHDSHPHSLVVSYSDALRNQSASVTNSPGTRDPKVSSRSPMTLGTCPVPMKGSMRSSLGSSAVKRSVALSFERITKEKVVLPSFNNPFDFSNWLNDFREGRSNADSLFKLRDEYVKKMGDELKDVYYGRMNSLGLSTKEKATARSRINAAKSKRQVVWREDSDKLIIQNMVEESARLRDELQAVKACQSACGCGKFSVSH